MEAKAMSGSLLREARRRAGLSQADLAHRAGTTQSVISAYESSARQPSLPTLARLIRAAGAELRVAVEPGGPPVGARKLTTAALVRQHRLAIRRIAASHGLSNVRLFGSVARNEDGDSSDVDLLVDLSPGVSLVDLSRCERELEQLLKRKVDLVPARDLKPSVAEAAGREATRV